MNKFYHVDNIGHKKAKSWFIIAKDELDAKRIALTKDGTPKTIKELPPEDNIQDLINSGKTGILAKQLVAYSIHQILGKEKNPKEVEKPWMFMEII